MQMQVFMGDLTEVQRLEKKLLHQIQFYFSGANLMSDPSLNKQINKCCNQWLPINYLLKCKGVIEILQELGVHRHSRRKKRVIQIIRNSKLLRLNRERVKRRIRFKLNVNLDKTFYLEFQYEQQLQRMIEKLNFMKEKVQSLTWKAGRLWIVTVYQCSTIIEGFQEELLKLSQQENVVRFLKGQQFHKLYLEYQKIRSQIRKTKYASLKSHQKMSQQNNQLQQLL